MSASPVIVVATAMTLALMMSSLMYCNNVAFRYYWKSQSAIFVYYYWKSQNAIFDVIIVVSLGLWGPDAKLKKGLRLVGSVCFFILYKQLILEGSNFHTIEIAIPSNWLTRTDSRGPLDRDRTTQVVFYPHPGKKYLSLSPRECPRLLSASSPGFGDAPIVWH